MTSEEIITIRAAYTLEFGSEEGFALWFQKNYQDKVTMIPKSVLSYDEVNKMIYENRKTRENGTP